MLKFFKDFLIYGFASILAKIAAILLMPLYTNILTKEEYGAIAIITACKGVLDLFSNLNIHSGVGRDYYEKNIDRKSLVSTGFYSTIATSLVLLIFMSCTIDFWTERVLEVPNYKHPFFLMLLSIPTGSFQLFFAILTRFKKKPLLYSIGSLLQLFIQITISIIGVAVLKKGIYSIFLGVLLGEVAAFAFFFYLNKSLLSLSFNKQYLKNILRFSLPTLPAIMAGWIDSSVGQIIIGKYISINDLAVYSVALQFVSIFTLISGALQNVWSPYLYENYKKASFPIESKKMFMSFVIVLIYITILLSLFSKDVVVLLSNNGYADASIYIPLLCAPMSLLLLFPFVSSGITISRNTRHIAISYVGGSILNIFFMIVLIGLTGLLAIPIALTISRLFTFIYMRYISMKYLSLCTPLFAIAMIVLISFVGYILTYMSLSIVIRVGLAIIISLAFFAYFQKKYSFTFILKHK